MLLISTTLDVSRIHGIGLFADQFIPDGTVVWRFSPFIDIRFPESLFESLSENAREQIKKYSYRERSSGLYVLCGDDARFFHQSDEPNCLDVYNEQEGDITVARQDIFSGQELTCDYSLFDLDLIEGRYQLPASSALSQPRPLPHRRPTL